jgi:uncharacterized membrane protein
MSFLGFIAIISLSFFVQISNEKDSPNGFENKTVSVNSVINKGKSIISDETKINTMDSWIEMKFAQNQYQEMVKKTENFIQELKDDKIRLEEIFRNE